MKRSYRSSALLIAFAASAFTAYAPDGITAEPKITVMNPAMPSKLAKRQALSERLDTLEGKTIYLVDIQWGGPEGGYSVLEEMQAWFKENMPSVKTELRRTKDNMFSDDPALWKEIDEKGDAAIVGIAQ
ncbi:MAG: hypothetical protein IT494_02730 [Gammaproteobacteria bacterium]|nr:hypothetical protein [Gammaproteobacteria bacterium]